MDSSNSDMTGAPNQETRSSVFGFDQYPPQIPTDPGAWATFPNPQAEFSRTPFINIPASNVNPSMSQFQQSFSFPPSQHQSFQSQQPPFLDPFNTSPQTTPFATYYGSPPNVIPGNFSFGSPDSQPRSFPVQFPFPANSQATPGTSGMVSALANRPTVAGRSAISNRTLRPGTFGRPVTDNPVDGSAFSSGCERSFFMALRGKRKNKSPPLQPLKQLITEEMMAEHMSKLHINSETAIPDESETTREKRLYMCAEMRKLQNDSIIPQSILEKASKPCTALVLWTPPPKIFPSLSASGSSGETDNSTSSDGADRENVRDTRDTERMDNEPGGELNDMDFDL